MQRTHSVYVIECECGRHIESRTAEVRCGECGRLIVIHWQQNYVADVEKPEPVGCGVPDCPSS